MAAGSSSQSGGMSTSQKIRSAPAIASRATLYWLPIVVIGAKNWFTIRKNMISCPTSRVWWNTRMPPKSSRIATKNWLLRSSSGAKIAEVRAIATL